MIKRVIPATLAFTLSTALALPAFAACPAEHELSEPRELESVSASGLSIEVVETVELDGWRSVEGLNMRMRQFTIQPGGRVPMHSHGDRPSILYFVSGEATEHNARCAVPIVHQAGTTAAEFGADITHWWANDGDVPAVLISVDMIPAS